METLSPCFFMCVNCRNILKSRCFGLMEKIAAIPTLTNWIKDVTIWLQFSKGVFAMSETKTEGLIYKAILCGGSTNLIYYGTMADPYIVMMQILEEAKRKTVWICYQGFLAAPVHESQCEGTGPRGQERVKEQLYEAMDFASIWLERA